MVHVIVLLPSLSSIQHRDLDQVWLPEPEKGGWNWSNSGRTNVQCARVAQAGMSPRECSHLRVKCGALQPSQLQFTRPNRLDRLKHPKVVHTLHCRCRSLSSSVSVPVQSHVYCGSTARAVALLGWRPCCGQPVVATRSRLSGAAPQLEGRIPPPLTACISALTARQSRNNWPVQVS